MSDFVFMLLFSFDHGKCVTQCLWAAGPQEQGAWAKFNAVDVSTDRDRVVPRGAPVPPEAAFLWDIFITSRRHPFFCYLYICVEGAV